MNRLLRAAWVVCLAVPAMGQAVTRDEVGRELARVATIDLNMRDQPVPDDYRLAAELLYAASVSCPAEAEIARLAAEAAWSCGERGLLLDATRNVIRADPTDSVAQLRLISAKINESQTIERRVDAYGRFLGPGGASIDPAVRSRLALDAALLVRELGDTASFESRLRESVELDPTNKDALSLAARTFGTEEAGIAAILEWQIKLLLSDPFDPHVHLTMARLAAAQGALDSATRFLTNAARLFESSGGEVPVLVRQQSLALEWQRQGAGSVLSSLNGPLYDMRAVAAETIKEREEAGEPHDDVRDPAEIRYDLGIERVRLLAANAAGDDETVDSSLNDMKLSTGQFVGEVARLLRQPNVDKPALLKELVRVFGDVQIMRSIMMREQDQIQPEVDALLAGVPETARELSVLTPWISLAEGRYEDALEQVGTPPAGSMNQLIEALAYERTDVVDRAVESYRAFALARSLDAYGAFARSRAIALDPSVGLISPEGSYIERRLAQLPAWVDRLTTSARGFVMLDVRAEPGAGGPLSPNRIRIRLRNTASIPLGLGASRPIGSRMLVSARPAFDEPGSVGERVPKVIELDRRLRLMSRESVDVVIDADSAYSQWLRVVNARTAQRDRYRVVQSFQTGPKGGLVEGPFGMTSESSIVYRNGLDTDALVGDAMLELIRSRDADGLRRGIATTVCRLMQSGGSSVGPDELVSIADAWFDRFLDADDAERALMLLWLPHGGQVPAMGSFDERVIGVLTAGNAQGDPEMWADDSVVISAMLTRVRSPDSPLIAQAVERGSDPVKRIASLLGSRLRDVRPGYATAGPGAAALAPPTDVLGLRPGP